MSNRKAVEGAIDFAVANATEPVSRLGAAGYIQGLAYDYYRGVKQRTGSRLGANGSIIEKIIDGGPPTTSLAAWFKFNTGITVTGAGVSQWDDQSGNARHLKQGTDTNRPALQSDGSILFDGSDNFLKCDAFTLNQPVTIYWLGKQVTWTSGDMLWGGQSSSVFLRQTGSTPTIRPVAGTETVGLNNGSLAVDTYGVVSAVLNGASSLTQVNNTAAVSGDAGATAPGGFTLSAISTPASYGNTQVKEVIIYSEAHDASTRGQIIRYLAAVGGISV